MTQRDYRAEHERRNEKARALGFASYADQRRSAAHSQADEIRSRALEAVSDMRRNRRSLTAAAKRAGTTPQTVKRYAGSALDTDGRRVRAKPSDRIGARMVMLSDSGMVEVATRSSRQREQISRHWAAVSTYQATGNPEPLRRFATTSIAGHRFATDTDQIERWSRTGEIDLEDIYSLTA